MDSADVELGESRSTWGAFDRLLKRSTTFQRQTNVAFDETVPEAQRLTALSKLRERLEQDPARQLIRARLGRDRRGTWVEELSIQTAILSTRTFDWMTPVHSRHHILFVPLVCLVAVYFFRYVLVLWPHTQHKNVRLTPCLQLHDRSLPSGVSDAGLPAR